MDISLRIEKNIKYKLISELKAWWRKADDEVRQEQENINRLCHAINQNFLICNENHRSKIEWFIEKIR